MWLPNHPNYSKHGPSFIIHMFLRGWNICVLIDFWIQTNEAQDLSLWTDPVWTGIFPSLATIPLPGWPIRATPLFYKLWNCQIHQLTENITPLHLSTRMHATRHKEREKSGVEQLTELYILYQQKAWTPLWSKTCITQDLLRLCWITMSATIIMKIAKVVYLKENHERAHVHSAVICVWCSFATAPKSIFGERKKGKWLNDEATQQNPNRGLHFGPVCIGLGKFLCPATVLLLNQSYGQQQHPAYPTSSETTSKSNSCKPITKLHTILFREGEIMDRANKIG